MAAVAGIPSKTLPFSILSPSRNPFRITAGGYEFPRSAISRRVENAKFALNRRQEARCRVERVKTANRLKMSSWEYRAAKYACRAAAKR